MPSAQLPFSPYIPQLASFPTPVAFPDLHGEMVEIPIDKAWIPYLAGAAKQLIQNDTFVALNDVQRGDHIAIASNLIMSILFPMAIAHIIELIQESEDEVAICEQLRYHNGKLQGLCCGEWVDIGSDDNSAPSGSAGQPGAPQPQPTPNGGSQCYDGEFPANGLFMIPSVVNTGDVLTLQTATGAGAVSPTNIWECVDGFQFFAGACTGVQQTNVLDPAPTVPRGHLLYQINGSYYAATVGVPFTVPSVPTNSPVFMIANLLAGNQVGSYKVNVCVKNNQAGLWTHTFDFTLNPGSWVVVPTEGGHWEAGVGFVSDLSVPADGDQITIGLLPAPAATYTSWSAKVACTSNTNQVGDFYQNGASTSSLPTSVGTNTYAPTNVPIGGNDLTINLANRPSATAGAYTIISVTITGTGVNPF